MALLGRACGVLVRGLTAVEQRQQAAQQLMAQGGPSVAGADPLQVSSRLVSPSCHQLEASAFPATFCSGMMAPGMVHICALPGQDCTWSDCTDMVKEEVS